MKKDKLERSSAAFLDLLSNWRKTLTGKHPNAIWVQLDNLVRDEAWFELVVRLRKRAGNPPVNDHLWSLFITGYGVKQSLAIRRLTDDDKRTASLKGLVLAMERNKHYFIREIVVGAHGTSMDVDALHEQIPAAKDHKEERLAFQRWSDACHAHETFDRLRDANPSAPRLPGDQVSDRVWSALKDALSSSAIKKVRDRCDTYLAHADLSELAASLDSPTYNDIRESIRTLVRVDQFLGSTFFNRGSSVLATYQGNAFEHMSTPLVPPMPEGVYEEEWSGVAAEFEQWGTVEQFRRFAVYPQINEVDGPARPFRPGRRVGRGK